MPWLLYAKRNMLTRLLFCVLQFGDSSCRALPSCDAQGDLVSA